MFLASTASFSNLLCPPTVLTIALVASVALANGRGFVGQVLQVEHVQSNSVLTNHNPSEVLEPQTHRGLPVRNNQIPPTLQTASLPTHNLVGYWHNF
ncbi:hypothetical protein As57867_001665, partial [Aphanomyces stellatus]